MPLVDADLWIGEKPFGKLSGPNKVAYSAGHKAGFGERLRVMLGIAKMKALASIKILNRSCDFLHHHELSPV